MALKVCLKAIHILQHKRTATFVALRANDVQHLGEHIGPLVRYTFSGTNHGPRWAWRPRHHKVNGKHVLRIDIQNVTDARPNTKRRCSVPMDLTEGFEKSCVGVIDVDRIERNT